MIGIESAEKPTRVPHLQWPQDLLLLVALERTASRMLDHHTEQAVGNIAVLGPSAGSTPMVRPTVVPATVRGQVVLEELHQRAVPVALRDQGHRDIAGAEVGDGRGVREQVPERDRLVGICRVAHLERQVEADVLVQIESLPVVQAHDAGSGEELRD